MKQEREETQTNIGEVVLLYQTSGGTTYTIQRDMMLRWSNSAETEGLRKVFGNQYDLRVVFTDLSGRTQIALLLKMLAEAPGLAWELLFYRFRITFSPIMLFLFAILIGFTAINTSLALLGLQATIGIGALIFIVALVVVGGVLYRNAR